MDNEARISKYRERLVRWQQLRITQLSDANNLFLTFNIAFLGFILSRIELPICCICYLSFKLFITLLSTSISFLSGTIVVYTRLSSFRATYTLIAEKKKKFEKPSKAYIIQDEIDKLKTKVLSLDKITWGCFYTQIITFGIGLIFGILHLLFN